MNRLRILLLGCVLAACGQHYEEGTHPPPKPLPAQSTLQRSAAPKESAPAGSEEPGAITGTIRLAPELRTQIPPNAYLYLIARERADGGPPYALKRTRVPQFPHTFTMGQDDVGRMFGDGIVFAEIPEMYLIARIDQDGMAMPQSGDLEGACLQNPIAGGDKGLEIVIDRVY